MTPTLILKSGFKHQIDLFYDKIWFCYCNFCFLKRILRYNIFIDTFSLFLAYLSWLLRFPWIKDDLLSFHFLIKMVNDILVIHKLPNFWWVCFLYFKGKLFIVIKVNLNIKKAYDSEYRLINSFRWWSRVLMSQGTSGQYGIFIETWFIDGNMNDISVWHTEIKSET